MPSLTATHSAPPLIPPTGADGPADGDPPVLSKDVPLDPANNTFIRIYLPLNHLPSSPPLPVIVYIHGGGFVLFSAASSVVHLPCTRLSGELPAIVASVEYRLAPEHPLPAAYDDAVEAVRWVAAHFREDPWLSRHGDPARVFVMGSSAGANIAYQVGVRTRGVDLDPVNLSGFIFDQPYFGGEERTESELNSPDDKVLPLPANDLLWKLSLPSGENRDHVFSNPMKHEKEQEEGKSGGGELLPRSLVRGHGGDPLVDRLMEFARMLERKARSVEVMVREMGFHGVEMFDTGAADAWVADVKSFVYNMD